MYFLGSGVKGLTEPLKPTFQVHFLPSISLHVPAVVAFATCDTLINNIIIVYIFNIPQHLHFHLLVQYDGFVIYISLQLIHVYR